MGIGLEMQMKKVNNMLCILCWSRNHILELQETTNQYTVLYGGKVHGNKPWTYEGNIVEVVTWRYWIGAIGVHAIEVWQSKMPCICK